MITTPMKSRSDGKGRSTYHRGQNLDAHRGDTFPHRSDKDELRNNTDY